jgi:3-oxoacyl-[acyl-carrier-protein] synthase III
MTQIRAAITAVNGWLPEYVLTNEELSTMVDTNDEWIMTRTGIKERRILKEKGKATSDMAAEAVKGLLLKSGTAPEDVELVIVCTITPDMAFPNTASLVCLKAGLSKAWGFDLNAACSGFIFGLETATQFITSGKYKKIILIGADMMSTIVDYTDRTTCVLFGDGAGAVLIEPINEELGVIDSELKTNGIGGQYLNLKGGGSLNPKTKENIDSKDNYLFQDGQNVFKFAVKSMADAAEEIMKRNNLVGDDIAWLVPHQANKRIIDATAHRAGLTDDKVMLNIHKYGNTTAATIPLCLWDYEKQLKKGDNLILAAFGGGFTWGSIYLKWAYDSK